MREVLRELGPGSITWLAESISIFCLYSTMMSLVLKFQIINYRELSDLCKNFMETIFIDNLYISFFYNYILFWGEYDVNYLGGIIFTKPEGQGHYYPSRLLNPSLAKWKIKILIVLLYSFTVKKCIFI